MGTGLKTIQEKGLQPGWVTDQVVWEESEPCPELWLWLLGDGSGGPSGGEGRGWPRGGKGAQEGPGTAPPQVPARDFWSDRGSDSVRPGVGDICPSAAAESGDIPSKIRTSHPRTRACLPVSCSLSCYSGSLLPSGLKLDSPQGALPMLWGLGRHRQGAVLGPPLPPVLLPHVGLLRSSTHPFLSCPRLKQRTRGHRSCPRGRS